MVGVLFWWKMEFLMSMVECESCVDGGEDDDDAGANGVKAPADGHATVILVKPRQPGTLRKKKSTKENAKNNTTTIKCSGGKNGREGKRLEINKEETRCDARDM